MSKPLISLLKSEAAQYYKDYHEALRDFDCGKALGEYLSLSAREAKRKFNDTMELLAEQDPDCPKERL